MNTVVAATGSGGYFFKYSCRLRNTYKKIANAYFLKIPKYVEMSWTERCSLFRVTVKGLLKRTQRVSWLKNVRDSDRVPFICLLVLQMKYTNCYDHLQLLTGDGSTGRKRSTSLKIRLLSAVQSIHSSSAVGHAVTSAVQSFCELSIGSS